MKLWLISQTHNEGYDTYDSAVVAAETEFEARDTYPGGGSTSQQKWSAGTWVKDPSFVTAKYLGEAAEGIEQGVICASFNAG